MNISSRSLPDMSMYHNASQGVDQVGQGNKGEYLNGLQQGLLFYGLILLFAVATDMFCQYENHSKVLYHNDTFMIGSKKFEGHETTNRFVPKDSYLGRQERHTL